MPDEQKLRPGPRRDLVSAIYRLYEFAGKPSVRAISIGIRERDDLPGTLSHEGVSAVLRGHGGVPRWANLESLIRVLAERSVGPVDVDAEIVRIHALWLVADAPPPFRTGLIAELRNVADQYGGHGLNVVLVTADLVDEPPAKVTASLIAAVRESLSNVAKHSGASEAVVRLATVGAAIEVLIEDKGHGFDAASTRSGFGIAESIRERMRRASGDAEIQSSPGRGTRVMLRWQQGMLGDGPA